jgi:alcohol dehydrogenase/L-iditol 2-dehydrogenase
LSGANPLIVAGLAHDTERLATARRLGATHTADVDADDLNALVRDLSPVGADLVCDATGSSRAFALALRLVRPDGQITKVGWSPDVIPTDVNPIVHGNVRVQGSFSHNFPVWERVIHLLDAGVTCAPEIIGLRAPLTGWRDAFDAMHEGRVIKSVLLPSA